MITQAIQISIFVKDVEEAKAFYLDKLGFVVRMEMELGPGWRYLTVAPTQDSETMLELVKADTPEKEALIGTAGQVLVMFASDDIEKDYREMKARGVPFQGEPKTVPGGKGVRFQDLYGNQFDLYQPGA